MIQYNTREALAELAREALNYAESLGHPLCSPICRREAYEAKAALFEAIAALSSQPPAPSGDDLVMVPRGLIGAACAAITKKHDAPKTLEQLRRYTVGDLSQPS